MALSGSPGLCVVAAAASVRALPEEVRGQHYIRFSDGYTGETRLSAALQTYVSQGEMLLLKKPYEEKKAMFPPRMCRALVLKQHTPNC